MKKLKRWTLDIFSEPDGGTICPIRFLAITGFVVALCMTGYSVVALKTAFDIVGFGTAYAAMTAALGLALGFKTDAKEKVNVVTTN